MHKKPGYGTTAKTFHWMILGLLLLQFPLGWLGSVPR
jgi:cytochrome b561